MDLTIQQSFQKRTLSLRAKNKEIMDFKIGEETFSLLLLIDKKIDDPEVNRFIRAIEKSDDTYIVNEPMDEDIIDSKDKWSCHIAEKLGVLFKEKPYSGSS